VILIPLARLQDRAWDETNTKIFPKTTELLQSINVSNASSPACRQISSESPVADELLSLGQAPTVEVFFARQAPKTGIKPHSDGYALFLWWLPSFGAGLLMD
jgi:hypothetical protein